MKKRDNHPISPKSPFGGFRKLFFFLFSLILLFTGCHNQKPQIPANKLPKDHTKENLLEMHKALSQKENQDIEAYIQKSELHFTKSPLAFWYNIEYQGDGQPIKKGNNVHITYQLSLLDGSICYTPQYKGDQTITIGKYNIIKGLDQSLLLLNEGGRGTFIIPSDLAFSMTGDQDCIGAQKTIIYQIKSIEIVP
jgi:FKBP-type peptidyl-prolyl cis-trans isomerase